MAKSWLIGWGTEGFELLVDLTELKQKDNAVLMEKLADENPKGKKYSLPSAGLMFHISMRIRMNCHRHIQTWIFNADDHITDADIRHFFNENPKFLKNFIRKNGTKYDPHSYNKVSKRGRSKQTA